MFNWLKRFKSWRENYILILQFGDNLIPFVCRDFKEAKSVLRNIGVDVDNYVIYQASAVEIMKGASDGE